MIFALEVQPAPDGTRVSRVLKLNGYANAKTLARQGFQKNKKVRVFESGHFPYDFVRNLDSGIKGWPGRGFPG
jgi:rhodanese-related sulfurtransferase